MKREHARIFPLLDLIALAGVAQGGSEGNFRTVHFFPAAPHQPAAIVKLMKGNIEIKTDVPFEAGDDWLKEITVVNKNLSSSKIVYVSVGAHLPETGTGTQQSPRVGAGNALGRKPEHAMYSALTGQRRQESSAEAIVLEPGDELAMPLVSERDYDSIRSLIQDKQPLSGVRNCDAWVTTVYFEDGSKWAPANYWRPEEGTPGKYVSIPFETWLQLQHPPKAQGTQEAKP